MLENHVLREVISKEELDEKIGILAKEIDNHYRGQEIVLLVILKGAVMFGTALLQKLSIKANIVFGQVASYDGFESTNKVELKMQINESLEGKKVILVDDTIETGNTIAFLKQYIEEKYHPAELKICTLIDKPIHRKKVVHADYVCFKLDKKKLVGFGLDYKGYYRNLEYIAELVDVAEIPAQ